MQSDQELFNRRHFLRWGISGAAAVGTQLLLPSVSAQEQLPVPQTAGENGHLHTRSFCATQSLRLLSTPLADSRTNIVC